jgi:hypothetical protein
MYSHTLFLFHTNGKELVSLRMNQKVQLPAGTYLCLQCADYKVIFNPEEMQAVPRRGIVIPEGGVFIPEDDCVYVRVDAIPGPIVYVSWPEVEDALREPSFRAIADRVIKRAVSEAFETTVVTNRKRVRYTGFQHDLQILPMSTLTTVAEVERLSDLFIRAGSDETCAL